MNTLQLLKNDFNLIDIYRTGKYKIDFYKNNPFYFHPSGLLIFCGSQGSGKTISMVQYVFSLLKEYPRAILCSNVEFFGLPEGVKFIEYTGTSCFTDIENGNEGVIYAIDEIHLEFNSLESQNISIEEMIEISQQRKQRKHIIGTTQVYTRLAKAFREQVKYAVVCRCFFGLIQYNCLIDSEKSVETSDGSIQTDTFKRYLWTHSPEIYQRYDTYAKMKRYKKEWKGRKVNEKVLFNSQNSNILANHL